MKKTIGIIISLILTLLILTGCSVNVDYEVKVNKNGSGDVSYIYGFSKETLESLQVKAEDMVASMQEQAEESDYTTEYYEDDEIAGFKATKHIENLEKDFSLQEAFGEQYVKDNENNKIIVKSSIFSTKVSQKGEIDLSSMDDNMKDIVKLKYTVKLPVPVCQTLSPDCLPLVPKPMIYELPAIKLLSLNDIFISKSFPLLNNENRESSILT